MGSRDSIFTVIVVVGCTIFLGIIFAPIVISIYRKIRKGTTIQENFSAPPYTFFPMFINCGMGLIYRLPIVHPHYTVLLIINGIGIFFAGIYIILALKSSTWLKRDIIAVVMTLVSMIAFLVVIIFGYHKQDSRIKIMGRTCVFSGILLYASTIPALIKASITKKVENVSLFLTVIGLANTILWLAYGRMMRDKYIEIQNGCGLALCCIQLTFYWKIIPAATDLPRSNPVATDLPPQGEL